MPTVDLSTPPPSPEGTLEALPRRLALTLAELQLLAGLAGDAPLTFDIARAEGATALESRLGKSRSSTENEAYAAALSTLPDPTESLTRRGVIDAGTADDGILGALGLLATPAVAVDIDLALGDTRARAWHRERDGAVATLSTADGLVFELAWFQSSHWSAELARVPVLPEDHRLGESRVEGLVDLPHGLLDAGAEAVRTGRRDLLDAIAAHHSGTVLDADGEPLPDTEVTTLVSSLVDETRGRLRAMVADIEAGGDLVGVVSWVLLADGWRTLRAHRRDGVDRVEVRRVDAADLASDLGPVLAVVAS